MVNRRSVFLKLAAMCGVPLVVASANESREGDPNGLWTRQRMAESLGRLSRLMPNDYVMAPRDPMTLSEDIHAHIKIQREESERREVSLAGVSAAAHGATGALNTAQRDDWAWHPAYQDALDLRIKFDSVLRILSERIPSGQQIMIYPCGCAALGNLPDGEMLPLECGSEGHERGASSIVRGQRI